MSATPTTPTGRPLSVTTLAALAALAALQAGDFEAVAQHAALPPQAVSQALRNLKRFGHITVQETQPDTAAGGGTGGRPRVVYTLHRPPETPAFDSLAFLRQHWR